MPGFDLFTRRRVRLTKHWVKGPRTVLDAGSGNGWFSYLAWRSGARVVAVNIEQCQIDKAKAFYNDWLKAPPQELSFRHLNLYSLGTLTGCFDEIICYETLEHIRDDRHVAAEFYRLLHPGGKLHLCCPFADHSRWRREPLDLQEEWGGHVRTGYTTDSYRAILQPCGFQIDTVEGMGGVGLSFVAQLMDAMRARLGDALCLPFLLCCLPFVALDAAQSNDCYSLYIRATKIA